MAEHHAKIGRSAKLAVKTILTEAQTEFQTLWRTDDGKLAFVDAKMAIRQLNARLQEKGHRTLNVHSLARNLVPSEVPEELKSFMERLEETIRGDR